MMIAELLVANTLPRGRMNWEMHLPRTDRFPEGGDVFPNASRFEAPLPWPRECIKKYCTLGNISESQGSRECIGYLDHSLSSPLAVKIKKYIPTCIQCD